MWRYVCAEKYLTAKSHILHISPFFLALHQNTVITLMLYSGFLIFLWVFFLTMAHNVECLKSNTAVSIEVVIEVTGLCAIMRGFFG